MGQECYTGYDDVSTVQDCTCAALVPVQQPMPTCTGFNLVPWIKENPIKAAAIGAGLWFLFFGSKKNGKK